MIVVLLCIGSGCLDEGGELVSQEVWGSNPVVTLDEVDEGPLVIGSTDVDEMRFFVYRIVADVVGGTVDIGTDFVADVVSVGVDAVLLVSHSIHSVQFVLMIPLELSNLT